MEGEGKGVFEGEGERKGVDLEQVSEAVHAGHIGEVRCMHIGR